MSRLFRKIRAAPGGQCPRTIRCFLPAMTLIWRSVSGQHPQAFRWSLPTVGLIWRSVTIICIHICTIPISTGNARRVAPADTSLIFRLRWLWFGARSLPCTLIICTFLISKLYSQSPCRTPTAQIIKSDQIALMIGFFRRFRDTKGDICDHAAKQVLSRCHSSPHNGYKKPDLLRYACIWSFQFLILNF